MTTERKLHKVWFFPVFWNGKGLSRTSGLTSISYDSYDEVPEWLRERIAVLHLLEEGEETPLGLWRNDDWAHTKKDVDYYIVLQPGDPKWGGW